MSDHSPDSSSPPYGQASDPQREDRLVAAMEEYRAAFEAGHSIDQQAFLRRFPDIADDLADCLVGMEIIQDLASYFDRRVDQDSPLLPRWGQIIMEEMHRFRTQRMMTPQTEFSLEQLRIIGLECRRRVNLDLQTRPGGSSIPDSEVEQRIRVQSEEVRERERAEQARPNLEADVARAADNELRRIDIHS